MNLLSTIITIARSYLLFANNVYVYDEVGSTNDIAQQLVREGINNGIVVALKQTKGRGREQRVWESSGLAISCILDLSNIPHNQSSKITVSTAVALLDTLKHLGFEAVIKWPNDVLLAWPTADERYGYFRKVAGILVEGTVVRNNLQTAIVGIGINTGKGTHINPALGAGFIGDISNVKPEVVFSEFLKRFVDMQSSDNQEYVLHVMQESCVTIGKQVSFTDNGVEYQGKAVSVNNDFSLAVQISHEKIVNVYAGEVHQILQ